MNAGVGEWISEDSALHIAAARGFSETLQLLLQSKADINARNHNGDTALGVASFMKQPSCVAALLEAGSAPNGPVCVASSLLLASMSGALECMQVVCWHCTLSPQVRVCSCCLMPELSLIRVITMDGRRFMQQI